MIPTMHAMLDVQMAERYFRWVLKSNSAVEEALMIWPYLSPFLTVKNQTESVDVIKPTNVRHS